MFLFLPSALKKKKKKEKMSLIEDKKKKSTNRNLEHLNIEQKKLIKKNTGSMITLVSKPGKTMQYIVQR